MFPTKEAMKKVLGIIFIILGFFALFVPFIPGSVLFSIGFQILGISILKGRISVWYAKLKGIKQFPVVAEKISISKDSNQP